MVKWFCDVCGKETTDNQVTQRLKRTIWIPGHGGNKVNIEIMLGLNSTFNSGVICKDCLLKMLKEIK